MEKVICTNCGTENVAHNKYCSTCGFELPIPVAPVLEEVPVGEETLTSKINKNKGLIGALLGIVLFVLIVFAVKNLLFSGFMMDRIQSSAMNKAIDAVAEQMNKQCPIMVDQYTRLDNVESLPSKTFQYNYTIVNANASDIDTNSLKTLKESIEPGIVNSVKTNPQMQIFRLNKATLVYNYRDKNGVSILKISVTRNQYE